MAAAELNCAGVRNYIQKVVYMGKCLPSTVALATEEDVVYRAFTSAEGESQWHTFNKWFDAVFGEDCRDANTKKLHLIRRGANGMELVSGYLESLNLTDPELPLDLMLEKLARLNNELIGLS